MRFLIKKQKSDGSAEIDINEKSIMIDIKNKEIGLEVGVEATWEDFHDAFKSVSKTLNGEDPAPYHRRFPKTFVAEIDSN